MFDFFRSKKAEGPVLSTAESGRIPLNELKRIAALHTDADFLRSHFALMDKINEGSGKITHVPILETTFTEKSKEAYSGAWMARELIQNWLDAESEGKKKYTLDGVTFREEKSEDGSVKFIISGGWALTNLDGLVGLSSEKTGENNAGGNGIGLKQVVLGLLRGGEYQAESFDVYATSTSTDVPVRISYGMVSPENIEHEYAEKGTSPIRNIKKTWLCAEIEDTDVMTVNRELPEQRDTRDACAYVISTRDEKTIELLRGMKDYGVHDKNPYLQDPDYETDKTEIKWMGSRQEEGKLFINGQIMDYDQKTTKNHVFPGPKGFTARFDNVQYPMSIDRAPINWLQLREYFEAECKSMSLEDLVHQLDRSKHLWEIKSSDADVQSGYTGRTYESYYIAVEKIVSTLSNLSVGSGVHKRKLFSQDQFKERFGDRYVCSSYSVSKEEIQEAEALGYTVCIDAFDKLGVPSINEVLNLTQKLKKDRPTESVRDGELSRFEQSAKVYFKKFEGTTFDSLQAEFMHELGSIPHSIEVHDNEVRIQIDLKADESLITDDLAEMLDTDAERVVYACRGLIAKGQMAGWIASGTPYMIIDGRLINIDYIQSQESKTGYMLAAKVPEYDVVDKSTRDSIVLSFELEDGIEKKWETDTRDTTSLVVHKTGVSDSRLVQKTTETTGDLDAHELVERVSGMSVVPSDDMREVVMAGEVSAVPVIMDDGAKEVFNKVKEMVPGITHVTEELEEIADSIEKKDYLNGRQKLLLDLLRKNDVQKLESGEKVESDLVYISPETLVVTLADLVEQNNKAEIDVVYPVAGDEGTAEVMRGAHHVKGLGERITHVAQQFIPDAKDIENFELITEPSFEQLRKLSLLKTVMGTFGYVVSNELFVFKGENVKGFNLMQRAIGLHESVLSDSVNFAEAFTVFRHEVAHNRTMDHGSMFIETDEALAAHVIQETQKAAEVLLEKQISLFRSGIAVAEIDEILQKECPKEYLIVHAQGMWNEARGV